MALFCTMCAARVHNRKGCPKHPMAAIDRIPPLDGYVWCGDDMDERPFERGMPRDEHKREPETTP